MGRGTDDESHALVAVCMRMPLAWQRENEYDMMTTRLIESDRGDLRLSTKSMATLVGKALGGRWWFVVE